MCQNHWYILVDSAGLCAVDYAVTHLYRDECDNLEHHCKRISVLSSRTLEQSRDRLGISCSEAVTPTHHWRLLFCLERIVANPTILWAFSWRDVQLLLV